MASLTADDDFVHRGSRLAARICHDEQVLLTVSGFPNRPAPENGFLLAAIFLLLGWTLLIAPAAAEPRRESHVLRPGVRGESQITSDQVDVYRARLVAGPWLLTLIQQGVDVNLEVKPPAGPRLGPFNSPSGRRGTESLLLMVVAPGIWEIEVRAPTTTAPGSYGIMIEVLTGADGKEDLRLLAERAMTEAARLYAPATGEARRQALRKYREALLHWRTLGDSGGEARALFALGALSFRLGETRQALDFYRQALAQWRSVDDREGEATTLNRLGLVHGRLGESLTARDSYRQALRLWQFLNDRGGEAATRNNLCLALQKQGEFLAARTCYKETLVLFRQLADSNNQARVLSSLGGVHWNLGEPTPAFELYQQALALHRSLGNRKGEAVVLNNLALLHVGLGEADQALLAYGRALEIFRQTGDRFWQARVLSSLGYTFLGLGDPGRARAFLDEALALRRETGDRRGEAITLRNLGRAHSLLGEPRSALDAFGQALELSRAVADRRGEATVLELMGQARADLGSFPQALTLLGQAAELQRAIGDRRQQAAAWMQIGRVHHESGHLELALLNLRRATELYRDVGDPVGEMRGLAWAAKAERERGRIGQARVDADAALVLVEGLRARAGEVSQRATFLASQREVYELVIDLLMQVGKEREALEVSERGRSRALLELVAGPGARLDHGLTKDQRRRLRAAERGLTGATRRQLAVLGRRHDEKGAAEAQREVHRALTELENRRAEIRRQNPRFAALTQPPAITADEIRALLDPDTLLLEYVLGDERSYLWVVDRESVASMELPGRREIEDLARQTYVELTALDLRTGKTARRAATLLSQLILRPVVDRLTTNRRLAVVADGALHYLPFAALPMPGSEEYVPLLVDHEIVHLPSASVLAEQRRAVQRRNGTQRSRGLKTVAVLADPVFDASDPRMVLDTNSTEPLAFDPALPVSLRSGLEPGLNGLGRLPSSGREAVAIAALVPAEERLVALGFEAGKARVMDGELGSYRYLHFATHGLIDPRHPQLSGLVLAQLDPSGVHQDGFLSLHDVYNLELNAELVVLSGCRTALGQEIRGEGLVGLTRGFMYAGVPRLVASLWQVQDRATAELMTHFYRAMLVEGERPAAALRAAQLAIRRERQWNDRFYWAAFVFQGDWRRAP